MYDPTSARTWQVDPQADKYYEWSPYHWVGNNPIVIIDPTGENWFYYQAEGEEEKSWHWQEGKKATYINKNGKERTARSNFEYLVTYEVTGHNVYGAETGTIKVYGNEGQDDVLVSQSGVFSGAGWWSTGENPRNGGFDAVPEGNYFMNLNVRDKDGPNKMNSNDSNPEAHFGIQKIPDGNKHSKRDGSEYDTNYDYGNGRIRLNPMDDNYNYDQSRDRGYYLHGKGAWFNRTHGCVCDKSQRIFNFFWEGNGKEIRGKVPFHVKKK